MNNYQVSTGLFFLLVIFSCTNKMNFDFLKINKDISIRILENNGFKRVQGVDVFLYEKVINDTVVSYQFDELDRNPIYQSWEVDVSSFSELEKLLIKYGCFISSECKGKESFFVINSSQNCILRVTYGTEKEGKVTISTL